MKSYSFSPKEVDGNLYYRVWNEVHSNVGYFRKFCKGDADEAMQLVLMHCLTHFDPNKGSLKFYIMSLARDITKVNGHMVFVDFLDKTVAETKDETRASVDLGNMPDICEDVVNDVYMSESRYNEVAELALSYMEMFLMLCKSIINRDSSTRYYSNNFIKESLRISKSCKNFNSTCIDIYNEYKDAIRKFLSYDKADKDGWREVDFSFLNQVKLRRIFLCDESGIPIVDADRQKFLLSCRTENREVYKVYYLDAFDTICDCIDLRDVSPMKFTIGQVSIYRTLGGSLTITNPSIENVYELNKMELLTNVLRDTGASLLNVGWECFYILCSPDDIKKLRAHDVAGIHLEFGVEYVPTQVYKKRR